MPIYLYQCEQCGIRFERKQRISEEPLTDCPECDGHVHRIIQPVGVIFKGSGFYITDNRQVSSPTLTPPKDEAKPDTTKSGTETESKEKTPAKEESKTPSKKAD